MPRHGTALAAAACLALLAAAAAPAFAGAATPLDPAPADAGLDPSGHSRATLATATNRAAFFNGAAVPAWRGRLDTSFGRSYFAPAQVTNKCKPLLQTCSLIPGLTYPYEEYILDPTEPTGRPVMKVSYPTGSWSTGDASPGGTLFYAYPYKWDPVASSDPFSQAGATLEYEVYFPVGFDWVKGGKLPGMSGGKSNGRGCGGGVTPDECFSFRIMWRRNGWGEAYLYVPQGMQSPEFCALPDCATKAQPCTLCDYAAGVSFYRGSWVFQTGKWTKLRLHMALNTPNVTDGVLTMDVDGTRVIDYRTMNWRQYANVFIEGVTFATWYGGSDATWGPPKDNYAYFRNVRMYYDGPGEAARAATLAAREPPANWTGPVELVTEIKESRY